MNVRSLLREKLPCIFSVLRWLYRFPRHYWKPPEGDVCGILEYFCGSANRQITFVQVGANDGNDEFASMRRRYHWSGVMVEPQRKVFDQLVQSNREPGIAFEMAAIDDLDGTKTLFEISFSTAQWATALASFDYSIIEKHIDDGYIASCALKEGVSLPSHVEDYCTRESVQCITLKSLIEKHHLDSLEVLLVDTEGYDYEIVKQITQLEKPPKVVIFEHKHFTRLKYQTCINMLRALKYDLHADTCNCIAIRG